MYSLNSPADRPMPSSREAIAEPRKTLDIRPADRIPTPMTRPHVLRLKSPAPTVKKRSLRYRRTRTGLLLLGALALAAWYGWNSRLLFSTCGGVGAVALIYRLPQLNWQLYGLTIRQRLARANPRWSKAIAGGVATTLLLYGMASVWATAETPWMGISTMVQDFGAIAIVGLLIGHFLERRRQQLETSRQVWLRELTAEDPLKRLIAVRELTADADRNASRFRQRSRSHLKDYLRLMLDRESDSCVRAAIVEGLQQLEPEAASPVKSQQSKVKSMTS